MSQQVLARDIKVGDRVRIGGTVGRVAGIQETLNPETVYFYYVDDSQKIKRMDSAHISSDTLLSLAEK